VYAPHACRLVYVRDDVRVCLRHAACGCYLRAVSSNISDVVRADESEISDISIAFHA
jgi:hypothetical protein